MITGAKPESVPHPSTANRLRLGRGIGGLVLLSRRPTKPNSASGCSLFFLEGRGCDIFCVVCGLVVLGLGVRSEVSSISNLIAETLGFALSLRGTCTLPSSAKRAPLSRV